jgi:plastocyanin
MLRIITVGVGLVLGLCQTAYADGPKTHIVKVVSDYVNLRMSFKPKTLLIQPGDTVTWVNEAAEDHNIVSYPDGFPKGAKPFSGPFLKKSGEKWSHTFTAKGTYEYH